MEPLGIMPERAIRGNFFPFTETLGPLPLAVFFVVLFIMAPPIVLYSLQEKEYEEEEREEIGRAHV